MLSKEQTETFVRTFITECKSMVLELKLTPRRLPGWLTQEKVRCGWVNDSLVIVVEDSTNGNVYEYRGYVGADTVILLDIENFIPIGEPSIKIPAYIGPLSLIGEQGTVFNLTGEYPAFLNWGYGSHHNPVMLNNFLFQHSPPSNFQNGPFRATFVPYAIYVHKKEVEDPSKFWKDFGSRMREMLLNIHNSQQGEYYEHLNRQFDVLRTSKKSTVIVLGKDSEVSSLREMVQIKDYLHAKGYSANIIKNLPEIPQMSVEEKVGLWTHAARFSVMLDRDPSGNIMEYKKLREQRSILALLRPRGDGSTWMIGDDSFVDINFIRIFEFDTTPLNILDDAIRWAEETVALRERVYNRAYPWRQA